MNILESLVLVLVVAIAAYASYKRRVKPDRIDAIPPGIYAMYPMGVQYVAIDEARTRWTIIESTRGSKCNRIGAWYTAGWRLSEEFIFTIEEARQKVEELKAFEESFPNPPAVEKPPVSSSPPSEETPSEQPAA